MKNNIHGLQSVAQYPAADVCSVPYHATVANGRTLIYDHRFVNERAHIDSPEMSKAPCTQVVDRSADHPSRFGFRIALIGTTFSPLGSSV